MVDNSNTITCSISGATRFEWLLGGQTVASTATLSLTVNDSIHHNLYICQGHNATSLLNGLHVVVIVNGMAASLTTIVTMSNLCEYGWEWPGNEASFLSWDHKMILQVLSQLFSQYILPLGY